MHNLEKQPPWIAYDTAKGYVALYLYVCSSCGRYHNSPDASVPPDWKMTAGWGDETIVHCPDCFGQSNAEEAEAGRAAVQQAIEAVMIGIHPSEPRQPTGPAPFALHLQRQESGHYLIAMTPETALMRLSPLEFFLSAEGARTLAWQLLRYADLVEVPGTLPASVGGQA